METPTGHRNMPLTDNDPFMNTDVIQEEGDMSSAEPNLNSQANGLNDAPQQQRKQKKR